MLSRDSRKPLSLSLGEGEKKLDFFDFLLYDRDSGFCLLPNPCLSDPVAYGYKHIRSSSSPVAHSLCHKKEVHGLFLISYKA